MPTATFKSGNVSMNASRWSLRANLTDGFCSSFQVVPVLWLTFADFRFKEVAPFLRTIFNSLFYVDNMNGIRTHQMLSQCERIEMLLVEAVMQ